MGKIIITINNSFKVKKRAALLAASINHVKDLDIVVVPHEPIEGKMFWSE